METRDSEDLEKPKNKSMSDSWEIEEPAKVEPELLIEEEKAPHADQIQDKEPQYRIPIQRNSIFNRTVKHRSKGKAGDTSELNTSHLADSLENGRSAQEPVTLNLPQSGTQTEPGAKRTRSLYQALAAMKQKKPVVGKKAAATKKPAAEKKPAEGRAATEEEKPAA